MQSTVRFNRFNYICMQRLLGMTPWHGVHTKNCRTVNHLSWFGRQNSVAWQVQILHDICKLYHDETSRTVLEFSPSLVNKALNNIIHLLVSSFCLKCQSQQKEEQFSIFTIGRAVDGVLNLGALPDRDGVRGGARLVGLGKGRHRLHLPICMKGWRCQPL